MNDMLKEAGSVAATALCSTPAAMASVPPKLSTKLSLGTQPTLSASVDPGLYASNDPEFAPQEKGHIVQSNPYEDISQRTFNDEGATGDDGVETQTCEGSHLTGRARNNRTSAVCISPVGQHAINITLQIAAILAAIAFGYFAIQSVWQASKANEQAMIANQIALVALCGTDDPKETSVCFDHIRGCNSISQCTKIVLPDTSPSCFLRWH